MTAYSMLTPESVIQNDIEAGVPAAIEYDRRRKTQRKEREDLGSEYERQNFGG
jgi:hypothetical protein